MINKERYYYVWNNNYITSNDIITLQRNVLLGALGSSRQKLNKVNTKKGLYGFFRRWDNKLYRYDTYYKSYNEKPENTFDIKDLKTYKNKSKDFEE